MIQPPREVSRIVSAGEHGVLGEVGEEVPGEPGCRRRGVGARRREPVQHVAEEEQQQQRRPEVREGAEERPGQRRQAVEPGAAAPGRGDADQRADHEGEDGDDAHQADRVRQGGRDHARHRLRVERVRDAEVEPGDLAEVGHVLVPHRSGRDAELGFDGRAGRIGHRPVLRELGDGRIRRGSGHEPREEEVQRDRSPQREDEQPDLLEDVLHWSSPFTRSSRVKIISGALS